VLAALKITDMAMHGLKFYFRENLEHFCAKLLEIWKLKIKLASYLQ
jgi:hypothetical protein